MGGQFLVDDHHTFREFCKLLFEVDSSRSDYQAQKQHAVVVSISGVVET
jgi:hypothetical protein